MDSDDERTLSRVEASDYHEITKPQDPRISPDGELVAYVKQEPKDGNEYEKTIYVVPTDGGEPRRYTANEGTDSEPRWGPSGDRLAFVSARGEEEAPQLWVMPTTGGEAEQVTDVVGGVSDISWSPDGEKIAFTQKVDQKEREEGYDLGTKNQNGGENGDRDDEDAMYEREEPDPRVIDRMIYRSYQQYFNGRRDHVYVVDLSEEGDEYEVIRLTDGDYDHFSPEWGDSNTLFYTTKTTEDPDDNILHDIVRHDLDSGEAEKIYETTAWQPSLAYSDSRLAYTYTPEEKASMRQTEIKVLDLGNSKQGEVYTPTEKLDRTVDQMVGVVWGPDENLYFLTPDEGDYVVRRAVWNSEDSVETVVGANDPPKTSNDFGGGRRDISKFDVFDDEIVFAQSEWDHPGDLFAVNAYGGEERRLTRHNSSYLEGLAVQQPEEVWFESDGNEIQGWILTPPDFDPNEEYPAVVEIHGGPHAMWTTSGTMWHEFQTLAARGYVVFWSNPRGSSGYGEDFMMEIDRNWGGPDYRDLMLGTDLLVERDYVDEENLFVTGGSFGGFMTSWIVGQTDRFKGAVTQRGVHDLIGFYGSTDAFKLIEWDFGTVPWEEPELLWENSPTSQVDEVDTPTLIIHSENDYRTPVNGAELFYLSLKKNGVETRMVRYPREGHELSRSGEPGHVVDRIERIVRWFDGYSDYHDAERAIEREPGDGLSVDRN